MGWRAWFQFHTMNALEERQQARTEREVLQSELEAVAEKVDETNDLLGSILDDTDGTTEEASEKVSETLDTLEDMESVLEEKEIHAEEEIEALEAVSLSYPFAPARARRRVASGGFPGPCRGGGLAAAACTGAVQRHRQSGDGR